MGLNYFKNRTDPVALADNAYPSWLWRCMDVQKRADEEAADDAGDEFCEFFLSPPPLLSFFILVIRGNKRREEKRGRDGE